MEVIINRLLQRLRAGLAQPAPSDSGLAMLATAARIRAQAQTGDSGRLRQSCLTVGQRPAALD